MEITFTSSLPTMKQPKPDAEKTFQQIGLLNAVEDLYGGVKVDVEEPMDCNVYVHLLRASITQWRKQVNQAEERLCFAGTRLCC